MLKRTTFLKSWQLILILLGLILISASNCKNSQSPFDGENLHEFVHQNGLIVRLPGSHDALKNDHGFRIEPADGSNKNVRFPTEINVSWRKEGAAPTGEWTNRRYINYHRPINYRIEEADGGSGGTEYIFSAYEPTAGGGYIYYEQNEQSENFRPDFDLCWKIIENTRFKN